MANKKHLVDIGNNITVIRGMTRDGTAHPAMLDETSYSMQTIDYAHAKIHMGTHFMYTDSITLGSAETQDYIIVTPNTTKWAHMLFDLDGSAITQFELYEGTDKVGDVLQNFGNNNRNSDVIPTTLIYKGVDSGSDDGTLIHIYKGGATTQQSRQGASARNDTEIILKQNTKYLLRITSGTASNLCNVRLEWYELISKTAN